MSSPLVAVWMITYNHEPYIAQAIESVMCQQTNFKYMLFVGEDCSKDNTREICIALASKYPDRITLLLSKENNHLANGTRIYNACFQSGAKYVAMLEGDDYWNDPHKLQKQVDFLEAHPDFSMCFHDAEIRNDKGELMQLFRQRFAKRYQQSDFDYADVIKYKVLAATSSYLYRNPGSLPSWFFTVYGGDGALLLILSQTGKLHLIRDVMSTYRMHNTGVESRYYDDPLGKAARNIKEDKTYLSLIEPYYRPIVLKRVLWNRFYRILKGVRMVRLRHIPKDTFFLCMDTISYLSLSMAHALRITKPK